MSNKIQKYSIDDAINYKIKDYIINVHDNDFDAFFQPTFERYISHEINENTLQNVSKETLESFKELKINCEKVNETELEILEKLKNAITKTNDVKRKKEIKKKINEIKNRPIKTSVVVLNEYLMAKINAMKLVHDDLDNIKQVKKINLMVNKALKKGNYSIINIYGTRIIT